MPTLFRLIIWCALIAGTVYGILYLLAYGVQPSPREAYVKIPSERVNVQPSSGN
jgi:hypothetical protein